MATRSAWTISSSIAASSMLIPMSMNEQTNKRANERKIDQRKTYKNACCNTEHTIYTMYCTLLAG